MSTAASHPRSETARTCVVVMGVSGCGKSTVGAALADALGLAYVDGDHLHAPESIAKMRAGIALTDADRWPWLDRIGATLGDRVGHPDGLVIGCSALKQGYRDRLRACCPGLRFLFLDITREMAVARMTGRHGHFMPAALVESQFAALERPDGEPDVVTVGADASLNAIVTGFLASQKTTGA
jgi:gluconokinase